MNIKVYFKNRGDSYVQNNIFEDIVRALEWAQRSPNVHIEKVTFLVEKEELDNEN